MLIRTVEVRLFQNISQEVDRFRNLRDMVALVTLMMTTNATNLLGLEPPSAFARPSASRAAIPSFASLPSLAVKLNPKAISDLRRYLGGSGAWKGHRSCGP